MNDLQKLRNCPFCGGKAALRMCWMEDGYRYRAVECVECGATTPGNYSEVGDQSAWDWNTRANDSMTAESGVSDKHVDANDGRMAQADSREKLEPNSNQLEPDSRVKLEADVYQAAEEMEGFTHGEKFINKNKILRWLDRQARITEREVKERVNFSLITQTANALFPDYQARVAELQEQVDSLTAERDEWKTKCETREVAYKQADAERKRYSEQIDELIAERDELERANNRQARKITAVCDLNDVQSKRIKELEAERDELRERVRKLTMKTMAMDDKRKRDGERWAKIAHQHQDDLREIMELREQLRDKQHVCDVQRDSFAKMEREYRELQDVCGELERTIENLRGD